LKEVEVEAVPTEMTFSVSRDHGAFEWAGSSLFSLFAQRRNFFDPSMWRMIFDILRFNQFALDLLRDEEQLQEKTKGMSNGYGKGPRGMITIGQYVEQEGYSDAFRDNYLLPMTAAVWSTSPDKCSLDFPAVTLIRFM
jgi:predicted NAD/FAD-binding protein